MKRKISFIFILLIFFTKQLAADSADSTLNVITYPFAGLADEIQIETGPLSDRLRQLGLDLPDRLQSMIMSRNRSGIAFLERLESGKIRKVIDYENVSASDRDIIRTVPEEGNAVLFTNVSRPQLGLVSIGAKIVSLESTVLAQMQVTFETILLNYQDSLEVRISHLADAMIRALPEEPPANLPFMERRPRLSKLTFLSGITVAGSSAWYVIQDNHLRNAYREYGRVTTEEGARKTWDNTQSQLDKRNLVGTIFFASLSALTLSALYDLFIAPEYRIRHPGKSDPIQVQANIVDRNRFAVNVTYRF